MITLEDWALIRRLAADGVPKAQIAARLGISRTTVVKAVASSAPPKYERRAEVTSFSPFEGRVRALLAVEPGMPATVLAERVGWAGRDELEEQVRGVLLEGQKTPAARLRSIVHLSGVATDRNSNVVDSWAMANMRVLPRWVRHSTLALRDFQLEPRTLAPNGTSVSTFDCQPNSFGRVANAGPRLRHLRTHDAAP